MFFIDIKKAYDNVTFEAIWKPLEATQVLATYVRTIHDMYCWSITCVRTAFCDTKGFPYRN